MTRARSLCLVFVLGLVAAACGGTAGDTTTTSQPAEESTTSAAPAATTTTAAEQGTTSTGATGGEAEAGVHVAQSDLGEILVDPEGFTLYVFTNDTGGESTCYDACAELWPPVEAATQISADLDASLFGTTSRTDGTEQLTVNGMPLYLYTPDTSPGDVNGQGFNGVWFVVDPAGNMIEASADDVGFDYGY